MEKTQISFDWNEAFFEKRINLLTNCQMGFVGAALMLMMMNLSKIYLLLPLGIGLVLVSWYKSHLDKSREEVKHSSVSFSPKSILFKCPALDQERRVEFRQIEEVTLHKEHMMEIITIYLKGDKEKLEIKGLSQSAEFIDSLNTAINDQQKESTQ